VIGKDMDMNNVLKYREGLIEAEMVKRSNSLIRKKKKKKVV